MQDNPSLHIDKSSALSHPPPAILSVRNILQSDYVLDVLFALLHASGVYFAVELSLLGQHLLNHLYFSGSTYGLLVSASGSLTLAITQPTKQGHALWPFILSVYICVFVACAQVDLMMANRPKHVIPCT